MMKQEIKCNLISSIKDSVRQIYTAVYSILEDCSHLDSDDADIASSRHLEEIEPLTNTEEPVAKPQTQAVFTEDNRVPVRSTILQAISTKMQVRLICDW